MLAALIIFWFLCCLLMLWWWNDIRFVIIPSVLLRSSGTGAKLPPGNMGLPFIGEMLTFLWYFKFRRQPDEFINSKRRKYGDGVGLFRTHLFGSPSIIACFPSVTKFVLRSADKFIVEWPNSEIMGLNSVMVVNGKAHARVKSFIMKEINRPNSLRRIALRVQPHMRSTLQSWAEQGRVLIAYDEVRKLAFENIAKLFASLEGKALLEMLRDLYQGTIKAIRAQPHGITHRHGLQCRRKLEAIFKAELEKRKRKKLEDEEEEEEEEEEKEEDLMDGLMQFKDGEDDKLTDKEIVDNIVTLILVAHETIALSSTWAIYYLAKYPNVLKNLREENMTLKENIKSDLITLEDILQLKYTNKVVEETIRLANVASFVFKSAIKDVEFEGYKIPKNWKVLLWFRYIHTDPDNFDDPMCFNPDRWNEPPKPGTFVAFSSGVRSCPGNMLARLHLVLLLHYLSTGYEWELVSPDAPISYLSHAKPMDGVEVVFNEYLGRRNAKFP